MKILVVGAGALGGYYGGRLLQAGRDVTFLLRENRIKQLNQTGGLIIKSQYGDTTLTDINYTTSAQLNSHYDLILVSCKAYSLKDCMESFAAAVGPETMILPVLNGMRHIELLIERFGKQHVIGGRAVISATLNGDGHIHHLNQFHVLGFGELDGSDTPRMQQLTKVLAGATFASQYSPNILQEMWEKWIFIASAAAITCLMRAAVTDIIEAEATPFALALIQECADIATTNGFAPSEKALEQNCKTVTTVGSDFTTSMLRDLEQGLFIEADAIIGDFLVRAPKDQQANFPLLTITYAHLKAYLARRTREATTDN